MIRYQVRSTVCPQCGRRIRRGFRRFGPAQVRCGHCNATLQTGLDQWSDIPSGRKVLLAIWEILAPSWMSIPGCEGMLIIPMIQVFFWVMVAVPFILIATSLDPGGTGITWWLVPAGMLVYPLLLILRLYRMIRETNAYKRTGVPPAWK